MKRKILLSCLLFPALFAGVQPGLAKTPGTVLGKPDLAIAAVVGSEAISSYDVESRLKFVVVSGRLSNTPDIAERIRPQVIRALIDEQLQLQEAAKQNLTVSDDEVAQAIIDIERTRNMPPGNIFSMLEKNRIPKETFTGQIRAQLAWRKLVFKQLRPLVRVTDEEVRMASVIPLSPALPQELRIAVLTLPVDKPARAQEVERISQNLAKELRAGASFEEVTRQFSGRVSRSSQEESFWVRPEQLDPVMARALAGAAAGSITEPIRTEAGYTVVKVYETRSLGGDVPKDSEVSVKEILLKLKSGAPQLEADALLQIGEAVAKHPGTCEEKGVASIDDVKDVDIQVEFRRDRMSALPAGVRAIVEGLKSGEISTPFASSEGIRLYMLCEKQEKSSATMVDSERIRNQLYQQKLELEAQKYLRNLRRDTFIELKQS